MIKSYAIIDLFFGDSGKGRSVDWMSRELPESQYVIRFNGGSQAAHNVVLPDGTHHTFSQFGSGTFVEKLTYLSEYVSIDPLAIQSEAIHLKSIFNRDVYHFLHINLDCKVITPYHRALNQFKELQLGADKNGSCGVGYGECINLDITNPELTLRYRDLVNIKKISSKLSNIRNHILSQYPYIIDTIAWTEADNNLNEIITVFNNIYRYTISIDELLEHHILKLPDNIFEGAQGILLDETFGCNPYTTWSNCTTDNIKEMYGKYNIDYDLETIGVFRSYPTRHGKGPFPSEEKLSHLILDDHNIENKWQDCLRIGIFDLQLLKYSISKCPIDSFILTHYDKINEIIEIVISYGSQIKIPDVESYEDSFRLTEYLNNVNPKRFLKMTVADTGIVSILEEELGVPCKMVSNGQTYKDLEKYNE